MATRRSCALRFTLLAFCMMQTEIAWANYIVEFHFQSYDNPTNSCPSCTIEQQHGCCDDFTTTECTGELRCDSAFLFCLRRPNSPPGTCNFAKWSGTNLDDGAIDFTQPTLLNLIPNPLKYAQTGSWQGIQLFVKVVDVDPSPNDDNEDVDFFLLDINGSIPIGEIILRNSSDNILQGKYGFATIGLTVRVVCAENYYGDRCQNFNVCTAAQINCNGRGTCVDDIDTFNCDCHPGYTGQQCETYECSLIENVCNGQGACINGNNSFTCDCNPGYTGLMCETNIDDCVGVNCSGNAQVSGTSTGGIAGGVIGTLLLLILVAIVVVIVVLVVVKRQATTKESPEEEAANDPEVRYIPGDNPVYGVPEDIEPAAALQSNHTNSMTTLDSNTAEFDNPIYGDNDQDDEVPTTMNQTVYEVPDNLYAMVDDHTDFGMEMETNNQQSRDRQDYKNVHM